MVKKPKLFRISTVPLSLNVLLKGQLQYLNQYFDVTGISGAGKDLEVVAKREGVKIHALEMHREISLWQDLKSLWHLYQYFRKEKPDIIHSITPKAGLLSMIAGKLAMVPVRMHTFTGLIFPHKDGYMQKTLIMMDKILCLCATHVYPEGRGVKEDLEKFKITQKPLKILGNGNVNGIDLEYFNKEKISEEIQYNLKQELGISEEDFVFVFVGRLVIDKGIRELVEAFDKISKERKNVKLLLVGPKENAENPEKKETFGIIENNKKISAVGFQEDVRPYFAISNVFVLPSYREGFPNAVLQALAMELPCIVTNIGGCNEIIEDGVNGFIFEKQDTLSLILLMKKMIDEKEQYLEIAKKTRNRLFEKYEQKMLWEIIVNEYTEKL